jgi:hypothetical protein
MNNFENMNIFQNVHFWNWTFFKILNLIQNYFVFELVQHMMFFQIGITFVFEGYFKIKKNVEHENGVGGSEHVGSKRPTR